MAIMVRVIENVSGKVVEGTEENCATPEHAILLAKEYLKSFSEADHTIHVQALQDVPIEDLRALYDMAAKMKVTITEVH